MTSNRFKIMAFLALCISASSSVRADLFAPDTNTIKGGLQHVALGCMVMSVIDLIGQREDVRLNKTAKERYSREIAFIQDTIKLAGIDPHSIYILDTNTSSLGGYIGRSPAAVCGPKNLLCDFDALYEIRSLPGPERTRRLNAWRMIAVHEMGHHTHKDMWTILLTWNGLRSLINHYLLKQIPTPQNGLLRWLQQTFVGVLQYKVVANLLAYIAERRADSFAAQTLANDPAALVDGALFFFNWNRIQTLTTALDQNPSWHKSCSYWQRYKNMICHYFVDPHEPLLVRGKRLLPAAGLSTQETDACMQLLQPYAIWLVNNRRSVLRILHMLSFSTELKRACSLMSEKKFLEEFEHFNRFMEAIAPEDKVYARYALRSVITRIKQEPVYKHQDTLETFDRVFKDTPDIDPIEQYLTNWLKKKHIGANPATAAGA